MSTASSRRIHLVRSFLSFWIPILILVVVVGWLSAKLVEPAPPKHAVIITGREDGEYFHLAQKYAKIFDANGIQLTVRSSAGSVDNYKALLDPKGDVDLAIVQGGTMPKDLPDANEKIEGIASLYLEPVWIFYRSQDDLTRITELAGKRIAIGEEGSGTQALADQLLPACGVDASSAGTGSQFLPLAGESAAGALRDGKIDAAFFVAAPQSPIIHELMTTPGVKLMNCSQAVAMSRRFQFVSATTLHRGSVDLAKDLPAQDVQLIAPAAILVARESAHKSLVLLGAMAAVERRKVGTLLSEPGEFPSSRYVEVPMAKEAEHFLTNGPSILQRLFPFWLASFLDRILITLLPMAALLIPIFRFAPSLYRWRIRARIYRWYKELRAIDAQLGTEATREAMAANVKQIGRIEDEIRSVHVPLSYTEDLYHLRVHLNLLEQKIKARVQA